VHFSIAAGTVSESDIITNLLTQGKCKLHTDA